MPLNESALYVLEMQRPFHPKYVFVYNGKPVKTVTTAAWTAALARAGITNFTWHDLRHTWASWLRMAGVPLDVIQELGGWKSGSMVKRYAHVNVEHLAKHVEGLPNLAKEFHDAPASAEDNPKDPQG